MVKTIKGRKLKKLLSALLLCALALSSSLRPDALADDGKTNVLVYMVASDLESEDAAATDNLNEMLSASRSFRDRLNLIVYAGGARTWHNDIFSPEENRCVRIDRKRAELLYAEDTRDMTDPETLSDFIRYCAENFPAERNVIILWDHGGGYKGFGADELNDYGSPMSPLGLMDALDAGGLYFDIIGFDACMMASYEMAYSLCGYGRYMVASEEIVPKGGWDYDKWLSALARAPKTDSLELCKLIVDTYMDWCRINAPGIKNNLSVVDLVRLDRTVPAALSRFSDAMLTNLQEGKYDLISVQRALLSNMSRANQVDMVDMIELTRTIDDPSSKELEQALRSSVLYNRKYPRDLNMNGLLIYVPINSDMLLGKKIEDMEELRALGISESYLEWLVSFGKYMSFARGEEKPQEGRTLLDAISGREGTSQEEIACSLVNSNQADLSTSSIRVDENGTPRLTMPEEQKELTLHIYRELFARENGKRIDYGEFVYDTDDFLLENRTFWGRMRGGWLYINDVLCPFFMESKEKLDDGRMALYGYTRMHRNDEEGALYVRLIHKTDTRSVTVEPLGFERVAFSRTGIQLDSLKPVSKLDAEDIVFFCSTGTDGQGEPVETRLTEDMKWGDVTKFEWKHTEELDRLSVEFSASDLYFNLYSLMKE